MTDIKKHSAYTLPHKQIHTLLSTRVPSKEADKFMTYLAIKVSQSQGAGVGVGDGTHTKSNPVFTTND